VTDIVAPKIVAFRTRADLRLVPPLRVSTNIDPNPGGVAVHYGGDPAPVRDHAACEARWLAWQRMHMTAPRDWNDIAYTGGYCSHGYAFAGRYYAVCWVNDRDVPTPEALGALAWWIQQLRAGGAGLDVRAHRTFHSTDCPGDWLAQYAPLLDGKPLPGGGTPPKKAPPLTAMVLAMQRAVHVGADGKWGGDTDTAADGVAGRDTRPGCRRRVGPEDRRRVHGSPRQGVPEVLTGQHDDDEGEARWLTHRRLWVSWPPRSSSRRAPTSRWRGSSPKAPRSLSRPGGRRSGWPGWRCGRRAAGSCWPGSIRWT
jgi:hypothetical protein